MESTEQSELTSSYRKVLGLALPVGLETFFQTSLGAVDQVIVGFLGASAVAGVGLANSVSFVVMLVYSVRCFGALVLFPTQSSLPDLAPQHSPQVKLSW